MAALVALRGVRKTFDNGTLALDRVDFAVAKGEFVSLLGPSGCGKSTALRIVAGLLKPTEGTVEFAAEKPEIGEKFRAIGFEPTGLGVEAFSEFHAAEVKRWVAFMTEIGLRK